MADLLERLQAGLADRYRIEREVGRGGMATVFLAEDLKHHRRVALKVLDPEVAAAIGPDRFLREIRIEACLEHPHIVPLFDSGQADGLLFYVMPYIEGASLRDRLEREKQLPIDDALKIACELAEALACAHAVGVIHRDVKPENVLFADGHVRLADFGIARAVHEAGGETLTPPGVTIGTPAYMSPEQVSDGAVDARSDQYALACVVYEMLAGQPPFTGPTAESVAHQHLVVPPHPVTELRPAVSPMMWQALERALAKSPADRHGSVGVFAAALREGAAAKQARRPLRGQPSAWGAAAAAVAAVAMVLWWQIVERPSGSAAPALAAEAVTSVVALPSRVLGPEADSFLTDAIPNTISTYLNQIGDLEIRMPPTSVMVEKIGGDPRKIAALYHVEAVLATAVITQADRLTLTVQLVEAGTRRIIWSRNFDGERSEYLQLARRAAEGLRQAIRPDAGPLKLASGSSEVEILYQRGLHHSNRFNNFHDEADFEKARASFERVLELEPGRADAAAQTGILYIFRIEMGAPVEEALGRLEIWMRRALQIDPGCAPAWSLMSTLEYYRGDSQAPLRPALRAVALSHRDAFAWNALGAALNFSVRRLALNAFIESTRLSPLYLYPLLNAAEAEALMGDVPAALESIDQATEIEPKFAQLVFERAIALLLNGRSREVRTILPELDRVVAESRMPPEAAQTIRDLLLITDATDRSALRPPMDRILQWEAGGRDFKVWDFLAAILARRGEADAALEVLVLEDSHGWGPPYDWLMLSPSLENVRDEPDFQKIVAPSRARFERMLSVIADVQQDGELPQHLERPLADLLADLDISSPG